MDEVRELLACTTVRLHPEPLVVVGLEAGFGREAAGLAAEEGLLSLVILPAEVTVVLTEKLWGRVADRFERAIVEQGYRLLTLDIILPWNVVGYLAAVTRELAAAGVSVGVISSHASDHLLIRQESLPAALIALQTLGCVYS